MDYPSSRYQHDRKRMEMEAEMSRFEQEISTPSGHGQHGQHGYQLESLPSSYEPLPRNSQLFIPHQIQRQIPTTQYKSSSSYNSVPPPTVNYTVTPMGLPPNVAAPVTSSGSQGTTGGGSSSGQKKHKSGAQIRKHKKSLRMAGGTVWEDNSLVDWDPNDFRLFCGDLGNDVTDEVLNRAFNKYPSFLKSKVIRDKRTNKTKGYGFVSFKDPQDFIRAMREMNGKYVGSRPIKLRKSTWRDRNMEVVKKKNKEKAKLGLL